MIKGQDIVILAILMGSNSNGLSYTNLGKAAHISVSEAHAAVKRLVESSLLNADKRLRKRNVREFLIHGLRYVFPLCPTGRLAKGLPTSYAAPVAVDEFASTGLVPVWSSSQGKVFGQAFEPIYPTAPCAAAVDRALYDRLAIFDMLRGGRLRERKFAEAKLEEVMA